MDIQLVFETHSISEDNEKGIATGWQDGQLSERGRALAAELGVRRRHDGIKAVFASDLGRAVETARIAFAQTTIPIFLDWRLRECNYGTLNGQKAEDLHRERGRFLDTPYSNGESWRQSVIRVGRFLPDLFLQWEGARVLIIGHVATRWAFDHLLNGIPLEDLIMASLTGVRGGNTYYINNMACRKNEKPPFQRKTCRENSAKYIYPKTQWLQTE